MSNQIAGRDSGRSSSRRFWLAGLGIAAILLPFLAGCGGGNKPGGQIQWIEGTVPADLAAIDQPTITPAETTNPAETPVPQPTTEAVIEPTPTVVSAPTSGPSGEGVHLSAAELEQYQPNELGKIPVLEYHILTKHPENEAQFVRPIEKFRADLEWLYEHDFYVVPLHDVIENRIAAPAGKHPVVLTFDDSTAGQFRFLFGSDGSITIDPDSAVGVMEQFYADHPDFGRGGFFALLPTENFCFSWQADVVEDDQLGHCAEKVTFLLDNGYEVGNHTLNHKELTDIPDDVFLSELGGAFEAQAALDPRAYPDILALPFGQYPDLDKHQQQRKWLRDGFNYNGVDYKIIGGLQVGANPADSPVSTEWDPLFIARIQAFDEDAKVKGGGGFDTWFPYFESDPEVLYTSDGNVDTITVPNELPIDLEGFLNTDRVEADGKELIRY